MPTYTYKDGYITLDGMCIAQVVGQAAHIKDMIAKANAASGAAKSKQEPEGDADSWIPWGGGECPVPPETRVEHLMRDGDSICCLAGNMRWSHTHSLSDIVAYRIAGGE